MQSKRLIITDDGSTSPLVSIRADDSAPWALTIGNDTYSTGDRGISFYQSNDGNGYLRMRGNSWENFYIQTNDGTTTNTALHVDTVRAVHLKHQNNTKLSTKSDGIDITGELQCDSLDVDGIATITSADDGKLNLVVPSGDTSDWNYIQFYGANGSRDGYVGTSSNGTMHLSQDGGSRLELHQSNQGVAYLNGNRIATWGTANTFSGGASAVTVAANSDIRLISGSWTGDYGAKLQHHNNLLYIQGGSNGIIFRDPDGTNRSRIDSSGHFRPNHNNTYDLGTSSYRWRVVYTNDLDLSNEGSSNDVDGTWGKWTLQEGEDDLFLINRRNGKKYKINMTEVD